MGATDTELKTYGGNKVTRTQVLAFLAGGVGVFSAWELLGAAQQSGFGERLQQLISPLHRARQEGRTPTKLERWRLGLLASGCLLAAGWLGLNLFVGVLLSLGGPAAVILLVRIRRRRYILELSRGAPAAARAMADALSGGHSIPSALEHSIAGTNGAVANELNVAVAAFRLGEATEGSLKKLAQRAGCQRWNTIVAATLLNRHAGGNLAELLNQLAGTFELSDRVEKDARSATVQARFTAWLVMGLPLAAAGLMYLGDASFFDGIRGNPVSLCLAGLAVALQVFALICVRHVARPFTRKVQ